MMGKGRVERKEKGGGGVRTYPTPGTIRSTRAVARMMKVMSPDCEPWW
jgi:hypothetical protein